MEERDEDTQEKPRDPMAERARERLAAQERIRQQASWVDLQIRQAMDRGDFDDLPGYGKPIADLDGKDDPDWWVKRLVEREKVTGVLPPALQVRKDDADLDGRLDALSAERQVREAVEEFNEAVRRARFQPLGGPPMITDPRDVETEVTRWRDRRAERRRLAQEAAQEVAQQAARQTQEQSSGQGSPTQQRVKRHWWSRQDPS